MSESTTHVPVASIPSVLGPRRRSKRSLRAELRQLRRWLHQQTKKYKGGTPAEIASRKHLVAVTRKRARRLWMARLGRRIDLLALLRQRRPDGSPLWAIVDPEYEAGKYTFFGCGYNGEYRPVGVASASDQAGYWIPGSAGLVKAADRTVGNKVGCVVPVTIEGISARVRPTAIPPLPPAARRVATDRMIRRRAKWVGLLYQPQQWLEERPDPAIVVEWHDLPGEYYALVVWGVDRGRIMEFVD